MSWSKPVRVTSIEVSEVNSLQVWITFDFAPFVHNCFSRNGQWMLGGQAKNIDRMMEIATVAMIKKRPVTIFWKSGSCSMGYPVLQGITLR